MGRLCNFSLAILTQTQQDKYTECWWPDDSPCWNSGKYLPICCVSQRITCQAWLQASGAAGVVKPSSSGVRGEDWNRAVLLGRQCLPLCLATIFFTTCYCYGILPCHRPKSNGWGWLNMDGDSWTEPTGLFFFFFFSFQLTLSQIWQWKADSQSLWIAENITGVDIQLTLPR